MTVTNLPQFDEWIIKQSKRIDEEVLPLFVKRVALEVFRRLIFKSPVGDPTRWQNPASAPPGYVGGRFRSNWQIATSLNNNTFEETGRNTAGGAGVAAINAAPLEPFGTVWVFNNVPYAQRIEQGWSGQAPSGVVGVTLLEITAGGIQ